MYIYKKKILLKSHQSLLPESYPSIGRFVGSMINMFVSTYHCEQLVSAMGYIQKQIETKLTDSHIAATLYFSASVIQSV